MDELSVLAIVMEEGEGQTQEDAAVLIKIRIMREIAERLMRPALSPERWDLFRDLVEAEAYLVRPIQYKGTDKVFPIDLRVALMIYQPIAAAFEFIVSKYDSLSADTRRLCTREDASECAGIYAAQRDSLIGVLERKEPCLIIMEPVSAEFLATSVIRNLQFWLAEGELAGVFYEEVNSALRVVRGIFAERQEEREGLV